MRRFLVALIAFSALLATALATPAPAGAAWVWPVQGDVITPYRNGTDPYEAGQHRGIDIAASLGTPVVAAAGGEVRFAGTAGTSGLTISIRTGDGYDTSYLHLSSPAVRAGARVSAGQRIGAVGTTGTRSATAPHLHFGVRDAKTHHAYHDPLAFLPPPSTAPAPERPGPAPAPVPEPARPAPTPAPAPAGAPAPRAAPGPRGAPMPRGVRVPRGAPAPRRAPAQSPAPALRPAPHANHAPTPAALPTPARARRRFPAPRPGPLPGALPDDASHSSAVARRAPGNVTRPETIPADARPDRMPFIDGLPSGTEQGALSLRHVRQLAPRAGAGGEAAGPDIGWAVACGALLLAAAILGLTGGKRREPAPRHARIAEVLKPLTGRR